MVGERTRRSRAPTRCRVKKGTGDRKIGAAESALRYLSAKH